MNAFVWTPEQADILSTTSRLTLVRAGPGSGKTRVFVELLKRRLDSWNDQRRGIAALSFTNVAREEIAKRLGGELSAPHFVGTLDSFFLRFVIGPFGHLGGIAPSGARLIPNPLDEEIRRPALKHQTKAGKAIDVPLFRISPYTSVNGSAQFLWKLHPGRAEPVPADRIAEVLQAKQKEWAKRGRVTHSDSQFLAAQVLGGDHGPGVRRLLASRFPLVLIDELQDTGHFLGEALRCVLLEPSITAVLVGDEDQKIFGFSGVDPKLFSRIEALEGCKPYPLRTSQRCAVRVAAVASCLSRSSSAVVAKKDAFDGAAVLIVHDDEKGCRAPQALVTAAELCTEHKCRTLAVLVRRREEKRTLLAGQPEDDCPLGGSGPRSFHKAALRLMEGRGDQAARIIESRLGHLLLENESPNRDDLAQNGFDPTAFRRQARKLVLLAAEFRSTDTWGEWRERMKDGLKMAANELGGKDFAKRLGGMFKQKKGEQPDLPRVRATSGSSASQTSGPAIEVLTVHEAKGREFQAVLIYCSRPSKYAGVSTCPSVAWWSNAADSEEREVAFVAATRAEHLLILAVHAETFSALQRDRAGFLNLFEQVKVECRHATENSWR